MIYGIKGWQDKGKTALGLIAAKKLIISHGYSPADFVGNLHVNWPGAHCLTNPQMVKFVKALVSRGLKHRIIFLDEVDRLFPARFWHNREQTEALIGLWQDEKLFNQVIFTAHKGTATDVILRECTQIEVEPDYDEKSDCIYFTVYNLVDGLCYDDVAENVSKTIFPDYDRWEIIGQNPETAGNLPPVVGLGPPHYESLSGQRREDSSREPVYSPAVGGGGASSPAHPASPQI